MQAFKRVAQLQVHLAGLETKQAAADPVPCAGAADTVPQESDKMYPSGQKALVGASSSKVQTVPIKMVIDQVKVYRVPRLSDWVPDLPCHLNVFQRTRISQNQHIACTPLHEHLQPIEDDEVIIADLARQPQQRKARACIRAGFRKHIVFRPPEVKAAIVTCGGLCPGLNDVVQEIVRTLYWNYGVDAIFGIRDGYRGFFDPAYEKKSWTPIGPDDVEDVHRRGGTFLGSTRGGMDTKKIMDSIVKHGCNQVYIVGGDGSHRAAADMYEYVKENKLKIVIAGVPKTIDNDIGVIDRSFGFHTAVEEAQKAIISARIEACCTMNGIGIVKLMGRESGMIAAHATIASREVDLCLIPEVPFVIDGPYGVLKYIEDVLEAKGHCLIVVSEGAGAELLPASKDRDASGNTILPEIGPFLKGRVQRHFAQKKGFTFSIKYHDPSYMIRSVPATASDSIYCMTLAQNVVHGAMAGFTGFTSALVNNRTVYLPLTLITTTSPVFLNPRGRTWERVLSSTHQPEFRQPNGDKLPAKLLKRK